MRHALRSAAMVAAFVLVLPMVVVAAPRYLFPHAAGEQDLTPFFAPADQDSEWIYYDDGVPEYYWVLSDGDMAAVRFTTPAPADLDGAEVLSVQAMLYDATGAGDIILHVWADDEGLPGVDLMDPMQVTPTQYASPDNHVWNSFVDVRFEDTPDTLYQQVERDIWVGYELIANKPNPLGDGFADYDRSLFCEGGTWVPPSGGSDLMIRIWWGQDVPVELSLFTYDVVENGLLIRWETQSETENFGYTLLRSTNLVGPYTPVSDVIPGAGTTSIPQSYEFLDTDVEVGSSYYYFLEDIDLSGESHRTGPLAATYGTPATIPVAAMTLLDISPNPFQGETELAFVIPSGVESGFLDGGVEVISPQMAQLALYGVQGRVTRKLYYGQVLPGTYHVTWDGMTDAGHQAAPGVYLCRLEVGGRVDAARVVLTR
jgi:hypothetical protein